MAETNSIAPNGGQFPHPTQYDKASELHCFQAVTADHCTHGREIVVVMGVVFVEALMVGIVADTVRKPGMGGPRGR